MNEPPAASHPAHNDNGTAPKKGDLATDLVMALRFFSRLPTGNSPHETPQLARIATGLPLASVLIGALPIAVLMGGVWIGWPAFFAAAVGVGLAVVVGGGMTEDGLADAADGLFGGHTIERRLEIFKDSRHGTYGVAALCLFLVLRVVGWGSIAATSPLAAGILWLGAQIVARSASLWLTVALPAARKDGASASVGLLSKRRFAAGMVFALVLGVLLVVPAVGIVGYGAAIAAAAAIALGWTQVCRHLLNGQTGDVIGALNGLIEIGLLAVFLIFA